MKKNRKKLENELKRTWKLNEAQVNDLTTQLDSTEVSSQEITRQSQFSMKTLQSDVEVLRTENIQLKQSIPTQQKQNEEITEQIQKETEKSRQLDLNTEALKEQVQTMDTERKQSQRTITEISEKIVHINREKETVISTETTEIAELILSNLLLQLDLKESQGVLSQVNEENTETTCLLTLQSLLSQLELTEYSDTLNSLPLNYDLPTWLNHFYTSHKEPSRPIAQLEKDLKLTKGMKRGHVD